MTDSQFFQIATGYVLLGLIAIVVLWHRFADKRDARRRDAARRRDGQAQRDA